MSNKIHVSVTGVNKVYEDHTTALSNVDLDVREGEVLVLLGPSGCGKSTLLRIIGGLIHQTKGTVRFYDKEISHLPPEKRNVGFVFQSYALFPTMTVRENIGFGLKIRKMPKAAIKEKVDSLLEMVNLTSFADRKPAQLSGGEQQRVAIARVLAIEPELLLMDEPLTALDAKLKEHLKIELSAMFRELGLTTIYVTHDQDEAMSMADRIAVFNRGVVEQVGTPAEIYQHPKTDFVAQFIGKVNKFKGNISVNSPDKIDLGFITVGNTEPGRTGTVDVLIRPEAFTLADEQDRQQTFDAVVSQSIYLGNHCVVLAEAAGQSIRFEVAGEMALRPGDPIRLKLNSTKLHLF